MPHDRFAPLPSTFGTDSPFFRTSPTGAWPERLRLRHAAIIDANRPLFFGAKVLDLASHDGRWSYAALRAGAAHVTGVELRQEHVDQAHAAFGKLGVPPETYGFHRSDIFNAHEVFERQYDLVLCLGILYHTARHVELLGLIAKTGTASVIVDTAVTRVGGATLELKIERNDWPGNGSYTIDANRDRVLVAHPSRAALVLMLSHFGYASTEFDWPDLLAKAGLSGGVGRLGPDQPLADYLQGDRVTIVARKRD